MNLGALFGLDGRTAIVAGASRGVGAAIAAGLASAGADVLALGRSTAGRTDASSSPYQYESCDVRDGAAFARVCGRVASERGGVDIYVHAAGVTHPEPDQRPATFRETIETNLTAAYECTRTASGHMPERGGAIVFVTSIGSSLGFPGNPGYVASKGGLGALTRALAVDLGARRIRVNAVAPGYIRTAMTEASYADPVRHAARASRTILGRWGTPEDVAGAVIFLVSAAAAYVTGQELVVDGGWSAKGL